MDVKNILAQATEHGASDIFIIAGRPLTYKKRGQMEALDENKFFAPDTYEFVTGIYKLAERDITHFENSGDDDFSFAIPLFYF